MTSTAQADKSPWDSWGRAAAKICLPAALFAAAIFAASTLAPPLAAFAAIGLFSAGVGAWMRAGEEHHVPGPYGPYAPPEDRRPSTLSDCIGSALVLGVAGAVFVPLMLYALSGGNVTGFGFQPGEIAPR